MCFDLALNERTAHLTFDDQSLSGTVALHLRGDGAGDRWIARRKRVHSAGIQLRPIMLCFRRLGGSETPSRPFSAARI
jgi:hypothetical protein